MIDSHVPENGCERRRLRRLVLSPNMALRVEVSPVPSQATMRTVRVQRVAMSQPPPRYGGRVVDAGQLGEACPECGRRDSVRQHLAILRQNGVERLRTGI